MPGSVADEVMKLSFTAGHVESMYRNDDRIRELFVGRVGSVRSWARSAAREGGGGVGLGVLQLSGAAGQENVVEYDLTDPTAQALVLRELLTEQGDVVGPADAQPGSYVVVVGRACLRREEPAPEPGSFHADCVGGDERYDQLERLRLHQEEQYLAMDPGDEQQMWLLTLEDPPGRLAAAAVLHRRWINQNAFVSYLHAPWEVLGVVYGRVETVPVLAALHVTTRLDLGPRW